MVEMQTRIDPLIADLVADLNAAGYETVSSCQGRMTNEDFARQRHTEHAFISFAESIPLRLRRKARRFGLEVYNGNISITPDYPNFKRAVWVACNKDFPNRVRNLFSIP